MLPSCTAETVGNALVPCQLCGKLFKGKGIARHMHSCKAKHETADVERGKEQDGREGIPDLVQASDAVGSAGPRPRKSICGTFGCILPDKHAGLHKFPDSEGAGHKRKQEQLHNQEGLGRSAADKRRVLPRRQRCTVQSERVHSHGTDLIGRRVRVWWEDDKRYYSGTVREWNAVSDRHIVVYDDGDQRPEALNDAQTLWHLHPAEQRRPTSQVAPTCTRRQPSLLLGLVTPTRGVRLGSAYQARAVPLHTQSLQPPPAPPPRCRCDRPASWERGRWWCSRNDASACGYEAMPSGLPTTPLCHCGKPSVWARAHWWCERGTAAGGCGFMQLAEPERPSPQLLRKREIECSVGASMAALLTAAAKGPLGAVSFVADSDCGVGLFARERLPKETIVAEYGGPRMHISKLVNGEYALQSARRREPASACESSAMSAHHEHSP